jgi:hypothetical protein
MMKRPFLLTSLVSILILMAPTSRSLAQDEEKTTVRITIQKDGLVTTDTTFELKAGQDPDMVKEIVRHLAGDGKKMEKEVIILREGDDECEHHGLAWVYEVNDDHGHITGEELGVNLDSIKEAHGGERVLVFKDKDGNVMVKELGKDDDHEMHLKHGGEGDHEIMIIESDEEGENIKVKKMKTKGGGHMMILSDDEDMEWMEGDDDVNVVVIKKGDKDIKIVKKVTVEIEDESDADVEKEVEVKVKKEKKSDRSKEQ